MINDMLNTSLTALNVATMKHAQSTGKMNDLHMVTVYLPKELASGPMKILTLSVKSGLQIISDLYQAVSAAAPMDGNSTPKVLRVFRMGYFTVDGYPKEYSLSCLKMAA